VDETGAAEINRKIEQFKQKMFEAAGKALEEEGEYVMGESVKICPWDTGTLSGTGSVDDAKITHDSVIVGMSYATDYAWYVHERVDDVGNPLPGRKPGTQTKYLLGPAERNKSNMLANVMKMLSRVQV